MEGLLFVRVPVVLVASENVVDIGGIEPARVDLLTGGVMVRVVCKQAALSADAGAGAGGYYDPYESEPPGPYPGPPGPYPGYYYGPPVWALGW